MKRWLLMSVLCISLGAQAQYSEIYTNVDGAFSEGVSLYQQGQYAASQRVMQRYLASGHNQTFAEQAAFYVVANAYELRHPNALKDLQEYEKEHTYTPYASEVYFMIGTLQVEKEKYRQALKTYAKVKVKEISTAHEAEYYYYRGYAHLQQDELKRAASQFAILKRMESKFDTQARYYYAICQYRQKLYESALPDFLAVEHTAQYKNIAPYYIIQIYYAGGQYDEVYTRAEYLLEHNPKNENNGEVHRILGEIYYQKADYNKAIEHLVAYQQAYKAQDKPLERNDIYLLGMSYYQIEDWTNAVKYLAMVEKTNDLLTESTCYHIANAYVRLGQFAEAKMAYAAAMRCSLTPQIREEAMYNYALAAYQSETALGESVTAFTDFLKEYPESKYTNAVYELLSDVFMHSKNYKSALQALDNISNPSAKLLDTKQYLRYQIGTDAYLQGKTAEAIEYFSAVIENAKGVSEYKTECYFWLGECYYKQAKYPQAQQRYEIYLQQPNVKQSANYPMIAYSLGYTLFQQKEYAAAQQYFESYTVRGDKAEPTYADALCRLGDCHFQARRFTQAAEVYNQVVALNGTGWDYATFQRAYALGLLKQYDEKIALLEGLLRQKSQSDYADDALYEIARAYIQKEDEATAITVYDRLLATYPKSPLARKAALEKGMLYHNKQNYDQAIAEYKVVIKNYPGSEEAYSALSGLERAYVEINQVGEYLAYTKTLGRLNMTVNEQEDSLTYMAAERQYMLKNYPSAVAGFGKYISQYCDGGRYCVMARYYYADSHYQLGNKQDAMEAYKALYQLTGNPYVEEACTRVAEIAYDLQDYQTALQYFEHLQRDATRTETINMARLGILRCCYLLGDNARTITIAEEILADETSTKALRTEAEYNLAKAYLAQENYAAALQHFTPVAAETRTERGAEAKYRVAEMHYKLGDIEAAEAEIMSFANMNTQHQYWLAKSFILLADIYILRNDDFAANQYLLSLQTNYKVQDDIQDTIAVRMDLLTKRAAESETPKIEEDEEDL